MVSHSPMSLFLPGGTRTQRGEGEIMCSIALQQIFYHLAAVMDESFTYGSLESAHPYI